MPRTITGSGKRYPLNMRTTAELRGKLEAAASASGRSLAQEVECRLERSLGDDDLDDIRRRLDALERSRLNVPERPKRECFQGGFPTDYYFNGSFEIDESNNVS